jgi:recombination protein RecT
MSRQRPAPAQPANTNRAVQLAEPQAVAAALNRQDRQQAFRALLGDTVSIERFQQIVIQSVVRNPDLQRATLESLLDSVRQAATLRLEPTGILGEGYLIKYGNEAQFEPGYRGLMKLARRSAQIDTIDAHVVYDGDEFDIQYGTTPAIVHRPALKDRGNYLGAYAWARLTSGELVIEYMPVAEIELVRKVSRNGTGDNSPWVKWWDQMAVKTVLKRLMKRLPLGADAEQVLRYEAELDEQRPPANGHQQQPAARRVRQLLGVEPDVVDGQAVDVTDQAEAGAEASRTAVSDPPAEPPVEEGAATSSAAPALEAAKRVFPDAVVVDPDVEAGLDLLRREGPAR